MHAYKIFQYLCCCLLISLCMATGVFGYPAGEELKIVNSYTPGTGQPIGRIQNLHGNVLIVHKEHKRIAYMVNKVVSVYTKDAIITDTDAETGLQLQDGSRLSLSGDTKLILDRSVYSPDDKVRSSFMRLIGAARFWVKKLVDFQESQFNVKTNTTIAGVRGSDFLILAREKMTEVTAFENTVLKVISLAFPEQPTFLTDNQRTSIFQNQPPAPVENVPWEDIQRLKKAYSLPAPTSGNAPEPSTSQQDTSRQTADSKQPGNVSPEVLVQPEEITEPEVENLLDQTPPALAQDPSSLMENTIQNELSEIHETELTNSVPDPPENTHISPEPPPQIPPETPYNPYIPQ